VRRAELSPAALGSVALHGTILVALLISWRFSHDLKIGSAVPVTIVANAPETNLREADQAPQAQAAQTEAPVAEAPPQAVPPPAAPQPTPAPPTPKPAVTKPQKNLDFAALDASLAKSAAKPAPAKPSSATQGPARPETALQARPALGAGESAAAISGLADELQRRWNPNCDVQGGRDVIIRATFQLGAGGNVVGEVATQVARGQGGVAEAAAARARSAVFAAAPFRNLPRQFYGERISVNFNAREACS
jgi:protein TonB